jgi:SAM-dependent methyltransferase
MTYVLGSDDPEIKRLELQASSIEQPTRLLLRLTGIEPGMRVLDLGTGLGHVARALGEMVGPTGQVLGLDSDARMLAAASQRSADCSHVRFVQGDVRSWTSGEPFDAVVGRLILFHLPDAVAVVRHHLRQVRPGGRLIAIDFDVGACRTEPSIPLFDTHLRYVLAGFRSARADPTSGTRLALLLAEAGVVGVRSMGTQGYIAPDDPQGPAMLAGVVRSLAPQIVAAGIATAADLGVETLADRLAAALRSAGAVMLPPALVGAWGQRA